MYSQNITLAPNTDYVLSAYIWNYGLSHPDNDPTNLFAGDLAVVQFRDSENFFNSHGIILEPQPIGGAMGQGANGYFVYKYFNSKQYPSGNVTLEVLSDPNEDLPGARPTLMAQWDNIGITPINQFSSQRGIPLAAATGATTASAEQRPQLRRRHRQLRQYDHRAGHAHAGSAQGGVGHHV
jgi:hypothetical protein